jgi:hypothetical protein
MKLHFPTSVAQAATLAAILEHLNDKHLMVIFSLESCLLA